MTMQCPSRYPDATPPTAEPQAAERFELHRQGAKAAARGDMAHVNPMLHAMNRPRATGESQRHWQQRMQAWLHGFEQQQQRRPPRLRS
jgi:hypothetical protein